MSIGRPPRHTRSMLSTGSTGAIDIRDTSVWKAMQAASRRKRGVGKEMDERTPSYMSARSFADGVDPIGAGWTLLGIVPTG